MAKKKKQQQKNIKGNSITNTLREQSPTRGLSPSLKLPRVEAWYYTLVFIAVGFLIFYPPYFRGLFFSEDMFLYHTFTGLVFILLWIEKIKRREFSFIETPLDWAILAYAGAYLLSLIGAVHIGEAFYGFLKALNYFMVYWMVSQVVHDYRRYEDILRVILASGVGVALIGILAAVGISDYPSAFDPNTIRILSTLQYPNTTAAYLAVISLLGVTLWIREKNPLLKLIYGSCIYLLLLVVLAAFSKGAWVILLVGAALLLIGMPGLYRLKSLYILGLAGVAALATYGKFMAALPVVTQQEPAVALQKLLLGFIIVLAGQAVWDLGILLQRKWGGRALAAYAASLLVMLMLLVIRLPEIPQLAQQILPENLTARISQIKDTTGTSYSSRMDYAHWGLAIVKDYPLVGAGAGGWNALYHQYQDYLAWTTETHNHFVQVWVEAGTIGFIAFISIWIGLFLALWKIYSGKRERGQTAGDSWILNWGTATAALAFGLHAAMDFDLSLGAMAILLWTLFALLNAGSRLEARTEGKRLLQLKPAVNISLAAILALVIIITGSSFSLAHSSAREGDGLLQEITREQQLQEEEKETKILRARSLYQKATQFDPLNANHHAGLAQACALQFIQAAQSKNPMAREYFELTRQEIKKAGELSPYSIKLRNTLANLCIGLNDLEGAIEEAQWAIRCNPNDINAYEGVIQLALKAVELHLNNKQAEKAAFYAESIVEQNRELQIKKEAIDPVKAAYPYWSGKPLELSPAAQLSLGKAYYLLGQYPEARATIEPLLPMVQDGSLQSPETPAWHLAALYRSGEQEQAEALALGLHSSNPQLSALYRSLLQLQALPAKSEAGK